MITGLGHLSYLLTQLPLEDADLNDAASVSENTFAWSCSKRYLRANEDLNVNKDFGGQQCGTVQDSSD